MIKLLYLFVTFVKIGRFEKADPGRVDKEFQAERQAAGQEFGGFPADGHEEEDDA